MNVTTPVKTTPFIQTHLRKDGGVEAMALGFTDDGRVLYRVRYRDGQRVVQNTTCASLKHFREKFQ